MKKEEEKLNLKNELYKLKVALNQQERAWKESTKGRENLEKKCEELDLEAKKAKKSMEECIQEMKTLEVKINSKETEIKILEKDILEEKTCLLSEYKKQEDGLNESIRNYENNHIKVYGYNLQQCQDKGYSCCIDQLKRYEQMLSVCQRQMDLLNKS